MKLPIAALVLTVLFTPSARAQQPSSPSDSSASVPAPVTATTLPTTTVTTGGQPGSPPAPPPPAPTYATEPAPTYAPEAAPTYATASSAYAPDRSPRPPSGTGFIVAGWIVTGVGALNLITAPLCLTDALQDADVDEVCLGLSLGVAAVGFVVGIPMLVSGYARRAKVIEWQKSHGGVNALIRHTQLSVQPRGAQLGFHTTF